ncbi:MAG: efflux RND transporter periplasmic adaptor subunit, partial [Anaerohalosphaera sp.]|nr:efflux RND transporter periplasmic adaptor subunit [Anaerohalosphaera sp.]
MNKGTSNILLVILSVAVVLFAVAGFWAGYRFGGGYDTQAAQSGDDKHDEHSDTKETIWYCSMDPQIRQNKPGKCSICFMDLIPLNDSGKDLGEMQIEFTESALKLMELETVEVERTNVVGKVRLFGKVALDETRIKYITAWTAGRIDRLFVDYTGIEVRKDDHLVELYSPQLLTDQQALLAAISSADNAETNRSELGTKMRASNVAVARERLRLQGLSEKQIAEIESAGKPFEHITIYSPIGGVVIHKNATEGMYVQTGSRIYTIADMSRVWVVLDAYESDIVWLKYGQQVEFTTEAYPGKVFKGTISFIDPLLNEKTRTVKLRVNVDNSDGRLKPEMFVRAVVNSDMSGGGRTIDAALAGKWICPMHPEIIKPDSGICDICQMPLVRTESLGYVSDDPALAEKPLVIPTSAALITGTRAIVYVRLPDTEKPTFEGRQIVLGPRAEDYYIVRSGLKEGELVVTRGNFKIDSSLQIMAKPSMMTPEGAGSGGMHDHGPKTRKDDNGEQPDNGLSTLTNQQMQTVIAKAKEVAKAVKSQDISQVRTTFKQLEKSLMDVDTEQLTASMQMLWMEFQMRLGNDAIEGAEAQTLKEAENAAKSLAENIRSFAAKFGLAHKDTASARAKISDDFR